ncbi:TPA: hypothetical protein ACRFJD_003715, partial [Elizabethkingia anophelis]
ENNRRNFIENNFKNNFIANPGTREEALDYIKEWLTEQAEEFIIIADPYFQESDIEILKHIKQLDKNLIVNILTNYGALDSEIESKFIDFWKKISDEEPPITKVTFCWVPNDSNNTPFHDRCIITKNSGLRIGTSFRSLGLKKDSEISLMDPSEVQNLYENSLNGFINTTTNYSSDQRIKYKSFSI